MFKKTKFEYAPADQDEIEAVNQPLPKRRRNSTLEFVSTWIFQVFLGTLFLLILIFGILRYLQLRDQNSTRLLSADSFFPDFPTVRTKFEETPDFMRFDEIGDRAWNGMIPNGAGYVKVPYPRRYDMEKSVPYGVNGEDEEESEVYQASVVHQLHCLGTLRMVLIAYKNGEKLGNKYDSEWHMSHCLNNIRQGILCSADRTLAFSTPTGQDENGLYEAKFNGIGTVHTCRNWEATKDFLIEHRAKDFNGTIGQT